MIRMPPAHQSTSVVASLDRNQTLEPAPWPRVLSTLSDTPRLNARPSLTPSADVIEGQSVELKQLRAELLAVKTSKAKLEDATDEQIKAQKTTIEYNEQRVKKLLASRAALIRSNNDLKKAIEVLETSSIDLKIAHEVLEASKAELKKGAEECEANRRDQAEKYLNLEKSHNNLVKEAKSLRKSNGTLLLSKQKLANDLKTGNILVQSQEKELRQKSSEIIALNVKLDAGFKLYEAVVGRGKERTRMAETNTEQQKMDKRLRTMVTKYDAMKMDLREAKALLSKYEFDVDVLEDKCATQEKEMRELRVWAKAMPASLMK